MQLFILLQERTMTTIQNKNLYTHNETEYFGLMVLITYGAFWKNKRKILLLPRRNKMIHACGVTNE